jgi:hypothetical protein
MLSQCANSRCGRAFLRLAEGKLFLVEKERGINAEEPAARSPRMRHQPRRVERYWLCDECAVVWTLVQDRNGIVLLPLPPHRVAPGRQQDLNSATLPRDWSSLPPDGHNVRTRPD